MEGYHLTMTQDQLERDIVGDTMSWSQGCTERLVGQRGVRRPSPRAGRVHIEPTEKREYSILIEAKKAQREKQKMILEHD